MNEEAALELFCWKVAATYRVHVDEGYPADLNDLGQYMSPLSELHFEGIARILDGMLADPTLQSSNAENLARWRRVCHVWVVGAESRAIPRVIEVLQRQRLLIEHVMASAALWCGGRARQDSPGWDELLQSVDDDNDERADTRGELCSQEVAVLEQIAAGLCYAEVAETLEMSPTAVRKHASAAYRKLGARNRVTAVVAALRLGLLELEPAPPPLMELRGRSRAD